MNKPLVTGGVQGYNLHPFYPIPCIPTDCVQRSITDCVYNRYVLLLYLVIHNTGCMPVKHSPVCKSNAQEELLNTDKGIFPQGI